MEHTSPGPGADLGEIVVFTRVVQGGSFTAASASLGLPRSTVSRKIADLEARVGARLLQRTTRTLSLTDVGRAYYEHCVRIVAELEEAEQSVARLQAAPRGTLRVTAPLTFSALGPILAELLGQHEAVRVELVCTDRVVDLVEERFDLALRAGHAPDSSLVSRRIGVVRRCLLGAPALLQRTGPLADPADLAAHPCLAFAPDGERWTLVSGARRAEVTVRPRLVCNDYDVLRSVARAGSGLALLPEFLCLEDVAAGRLAQALPGWSAPDVPVFALYPSTRHLSPKVIALLELLQGRLRLNLGPDPG